MECKGLYHHEGYPLCRAYIDLFNGCMTENLGGPTQMKEEYRDPEELSRLLEEIQQQALSSSDCEFLDTDNPFKDNESHLGREVSYFVCSKHWEKEQQDTKEKSPSLVEISLQFVGFR